MRESVEEQRLNASSMGLRQANFGDGGEQKKVANEKMATLNAKKEIRVGEAILQPGRNRWREGFRTPLQAVVITSTRRG